MNREYGELSSLYYDLSKPVAYFLAGDIEYFLEKLKNISGRVLEAGVGTGRILIPLIKNGITVDGVDSSMEMLKQAKINLKKHAVDAVLYEQNLINLSLPHKYDAIILPTGSICLFSRDLLKKILQNFYQHLNMGGKIIIDLEMPISFQEDSTMSSSVRLSKDSSISLSSYSEKICWLAQKTSYINKYELIEKGKIIKTEIANLHLYWYGILEFESLLSLVNYKDITYEIGYGKQQSDIVIFTAYKLR